MEDKNARIAEIESQIKKLQSELAELQKDQSEEQSSKYPNSKLPDVVNEIWDEMERGERRVVARWKILGKILRQSSMKSQSA